MNKVSKNISSYKPSQGTYKMVYFKNNKKKLNFIFYNKFKVSAGKISLMSGKNCQLFICICLCKNTILIFIKFIRQLHSPVSKQHESNLNAGNIHINKMLIC